MASLCNTLTKYSHRAFEMIIFTMGDNLSEITMIFGNLIYHCLIMVLNQRGQKRAVIVEWLHFHKITKQWQS